MLDIKFIRENKEIVQEAAKNKNVKLDIEELISLDERRLKELVEIENLRGEQNKASMQIGRNQDPMLKTQLIKEMSIVKEDLKQKEEKFAETMKAWQTIMMQVPNIPSPDTPIGPDESGNVPIRSWGEKPVFDFTPKEHFEIGEKLGIIDNETAAEISGARFTYLKGDLVLLQFALVSHLFGILTD